jgi:hypothetical protein
VELCSTPPHRSGASVELSSTPGHGVFISRVDCRLLFWCRHRGDRIMMLGLVQGYQLVHLLRQRHQVGEVILRQQHPDLVRQPLQEVIRISVCLLISAARS